VTSVSRHNERHLTIEELSALLDGQLSEQEQVHCDAHLATCQQCSLALTDLRQTASLLRALPEPQLPRSFTLSTGVSYIQERRASSAVQADPAAIAAPADQERQQRLRARRTTLRRTARALSLIAAVIGLFLLGTGVFAVLPRSANNANTATTGSSAGSSAPNAVPQQAATTVSTPSTVKKSNTPNVVAHGTLGPHIGPQARRNISHNAESPTAGPALPLPNLSTPLGQQEVGFLLVALGIIGLLLSWRRRRTENAP
jgi:anti-sigma factor RsiW